MGMVLPFDAPVRNVVHSGSGRVDPGERGGRVDSVDGVDGVDHGT
jgi:hypothetical protein